MRYWQKMELLMAEGSYLCFVVIEDHLESASEVSSNCFHSPVEIYYVTSFQKL